jgi:hypothetical protein
MPVIIFMPCAPVAQLDRASGYEPEGREFESPRARHLVGLPFTDRYSLATQPLALKIEV